MEIPTPVKGMVRCIVIFFLLPLLTAGVVNAQTPGPTPGLDQPLGYPDQPLGYPDQPLGYPDQPLGYNEADAYAIDGMIMCPVCPAETIDQAQVPIARQMRALVREKLAEGATRQEILDFFAERYGQDILASPPKSGFNLVAWVFPLVGVAAALLAGLAVLRSMSARRVDQIATTPQFSGAADELDPYLARVDQELASRQNLPVTEEVSLEDSSGGGTSGCPVGNGESQRERN